jgi:acetyl esterase/lipase
MSVDHLPATSPPKRVILWIHGGCFTDGDETWSAKVVKALTEAGAVVCTVSFPQGEQNPWPAAMPVLEACVARLAATYAGIPLAIGGESSGAFYACHVGNAMGIAECVVLAPVLDPYARRARVSRQKAQKQLAYFGSDDAMEAATVRSYGGKLSIICGSEDRDASYDASLGNVTLIAGATHAIVGKPTKEVLRAITEAFTLPLVPNLQ